MSGSGWHRDFMRPAYWPVADWEYTVDRTAAEAGCLERRLPARGTVLDGAPLRESTVDAAACVQSFGWGSEADQAALLESIAPMLFPAAGWCST